jgi:hypothetical protein
MKTLNINLSYSLRLSTLDRKVIMEQLEHTAILTGIMEEVYPVLAYNTVQITHFDSDYPEPLYRSKEIPFISPRTILWNDEGQCISTFSCLTLPRDILLNNRHITDLQQNRSGLGGIWNSFFDLLEPQYKEGKVIARINNPILSLEL